MWRALIDQLRLVTPTKEMATEPMPSIETDCISSQQPFHANNKISAGRLRDQMKMVRHKAIGMNLPTGFLTSSLETFQEQIPIGVAAKNCLAPIPAIHHVVERARIFHT
jgi:hypothetical protein